jgi:hypothetical protein
MCVIAVSLKGKKFSEENLRKMWDSNSHGAGIAWIEKGKVRVVKGLMTFDNFIEVYKSISEGVVHAVHFRLKSAGEVVPQLTHPFRIDSLDMQQLRYQAKSVLFHNGTVSHWQSLFISILSSFTKKQRDKILALKNVSDTYVVSLIVYRYGYQILKHIDGISRWLIFKPEPVFYGLWEEDRRNGFKYSNMSWKYSYSGVGVGYSYRTLSNGWKGENSCDVGCSGVGGWLNKDDKDEDM